MVKDAKITLDMLREAKPRTIGKKEFRGNRGYKCYLCKGHIGNGAKIFSIKKDFEFDYFFEYIHAKCRTVKMVQLRINGEN